VNPDWWERGLFESAVKAAAAELPGGMLDVLAVSGVLVRGTALVKNGFYKREFTLIKLRMSSNRSSKFDGLSILEGVSRVFTSKQ
jgi:hypothetical protein